MPLRALLLPALVAALALAACGGGDDERSAGIIHRLLLAAATDDTGLLESYSGELPPDLPAEPPIYPDAEVVVSSRQPSPAGGFEEEGGVIPAPLLYFIVLDTSDSREQVRRFYEESLDEEPWQLESSFSTSQLDTIQFFNVADADISGVVSIAAGGDDRRTSILISFQDAGAFVEEELPFRPGESIGLPKEFPDEVPVYDGGIVTGTAFFREPQDLSFLLIFITTDGQEDVVAFYRETFEELGWTVETGQTFGFEERITVADGAGDVQGELTADRFARSDDYTEVRLQLRISPARDIGPPPTPEETP